MGFGQIKRHLSNWGVVAMDTKSPKIGGHLSVFTANVAGVNVRVARHHRYRATIEVFKNNQYDYFTRSYYLFQCIRNWFTTEVLISKGVYMNLKLLSWRAAVFRLHSLDWHTDINFHSDEHPLLRRVFCDYAALRDQSSFMALKDLLIDHIPKFAKEMEQIQ